jgi:transcriptional regulator with XRE-family HTH domain
MPDSNSPVILRNKMLGVLLQEARKKARRNPREAAEAIGMRTAQLLAYENGKRSITLPELEALAYTYDVPIRYFLHGAQFLTSERREKIELARLATIRQKMMSTKLRQLRAEKNLHLGELAKKTGLSIGRIKSYENGFRQIPLVDLESLSSALDVEVDYFLEFHGIVGEWELDRESDDQFRQLPSDIRRFAAQPIHEPFLRLAMQLSELPAGRLRDIAEAILDITL